MKTNVTFHSGRSLPAWSAVVRAAPLLIVGLIGWLWLASADDSAWKAVSLAVVLVLAALVGISWYLLRARANRRWRAALDAYAEKEEKELAKRPYSWRPSHAGP